MPTSPASRPERRPRLTQLAQQAVAAVLQPGDLAVDATAGNGHDTLFLAEQVGPDGRVLAFDVQPRALANTRERLRQAGLLERVELFDMGHEQLGRILADQTGRPLRALMFNLGYLPGGDKQRVTQAETTLIALEAGARTLAPGGIISVLVYIGHPGGPEELAAVTRWAGQLDTCGWRIERQAGDHPRSPVWFGLQRLS